MSGIFTKSFISFEIDVGAECITRFERTMIPSRLIIPWAYIEIKVLVSAGSAYLLLGEFAFWNMMSAVVIDATDESSNSSF